MSYENLTFEVEGGVATISVDRPKALNALDPKTLDELEQAIGEVTSRDDVRGAIVTGAGPKAFVAGADLKHLAEVRKGDGSRAEARRGQAVFDAISSCQKPVIGCVNGFALGGGLELALACHFRYAVKRAKLGLPEVKLGLIPGYGGTQRLSRLVGRGAATELILCGEPIGSEEALRIGLVNRVFDDKDSMLAAARETLTAIGQRGPVAIRLALDAIHRGLDLDMEGGLALEADLFGIACGSEDAGEGISAFLEKREAQFKGH